MKTLLSGNAQRKLCTVLAGGAALMLVSSYATASISTTRHNLGSTNSAPLHNGPNGNTVSGSVANKFDGTAEICVFCHTPHGADSSASVPIWNRSMSAPSSYTRYTALGTSTFDAAEAPIGSVSLACLSCHDGTQAMNVVINTPGSGTTTTIAGGWLGGNVDNVTGQMTSGVNGNVAGKGEFPRLGTDLSNDHPVSMQFGGGGIAVGQMSGPTIDPDFAQSTGSSTPSYAGGYANRVGTRTLGNSKVVWWVETGGTGSGGTDGAYDKHDLNLYTRSDGTFAARTGSLAGSVDQPYVECASCHDPHSNNTTFLRRDDGNIGSATCLTCHNK
jgi:predicted CXXCH cytochrome family protein